MTSLLASGLSSSVVGTMAGQTIMQDFVGFRIPLWLRRLVTMLPAFVVVAMGVNATQALVVSQVVLSLVLPVPMIALLVLAGRRDMMGTFVVRGWTRLRRAGRGRWWCWALNMILLLQTVGVPITVSDAAIRAMTGRYGDSGKPDAARRMLPDEPTQAIRFGKARSAQSGALLEDYVELISDLLAINGEARPTDIARRLGVSHATAIKTIGRLKREGLAVAKPYRGVFLTEGGEQLADRVRARHRRGGGSAAGGRRAGRGGRTGCRGDRASRFGHDAGGVRAVPEAAGVVRVRPKQPNRLVAADGFPRHADHRVMRPELRPILPFRGDHPERDQGT